MIYLITFFAVPVFHAYGHTGECQVLLLTSVHKYIHGCIAMYVSTYVY